MIEALVSDLPEVYQPIYGHPDLGDQAARPCVDRLQHITQVYDAMSDVLGRSLRVLDLGCAQGYFSMNLAARGANVVGIDYLDKNIAVCDALAKENSQFNAKFELGRIEDTILGLKSNSYDLVLGLSVFHHIIHEKGADTVQSLVKRAASMAGALIVEMALRDEPLFWNEAQPTSPVEFLSPIAFVHEIARHGTHLGAVRRPLFVASDYYWIVAGSTVRFDSWTQYSHALAKDAHRGSRRYFFSAHSVLKQYRLDHSLGIHNKEEFDREVHFLSGPPSSFSAPKLLAFGEDRTHSWIVVERLDGEVVLDIMRHGLPLDHRSILLSILAQLAVLEINGLYHNDVRAWNILVNKNGDARLIDYGAISPIARDCVWPQNVFLSFLILVKEISTGGVDDPNPMRGVSISPYGLPEPYRSWASTLWSRPLTEWSFRLMHETLLAAALNVPEKPLIDANTAWMKAIEESIDTQKKFVNHAVGEVNGKVDGLRLDASDKLLVNLEKIEHNLRDIYSGIERQKVDIDCIKNGSEVIASLQHEVSNINLYLTSEKCEVKGLKEAFLQKSEEVRFLESKVSDLDEMLRTFQERALRAEGETKYLERRLRETSEQGAVLEARVAELSKYSTACLQSIEELQSHRDALLKSTSWRLTKPVRWIGRYFFAGRGDRS